MLLFVLLTLTLYVTLHTLLICCHCAQYCYQASPATVSRVGMIFCEVRNLGWQPLCDVWLDGLPATLQDHRAHVRELFSWLFPPAIYFVQKVLLALLLIMLTGLA
jgi:hypothetical protein